MLEADEGAGEFSKGAWALQLLRGWKRQWAAPARTLSLGYHTGKLACVWQCEQPPYLLGTRNLLRIKQPQLWEALC